MKKVFILALAVVGVLASCSKKDDNKTTNPLIGTWDIVSFVEGRQRVVLNDCMKKSYITFAESTYKEVLSDIDTATQCFEATSKGVYSISGNTIKTTEECTGQKIEYTYVISGNTLTLTSTEDGLILVQTYKKR